MSAPIERVYDSTERIVSICAPSEPWVAVSGVDWAPYWNTANIAVWASVLRVESVFPGAHEPEKLTSTSERQSVEVVGMCPMGEGAALEEAGHLHLFVGYAALRDTRLLDALKREAIKASEEFRAKGEARKAAQAVAK